MGIGTVIAGLAVAGVGLWPFAVEWRRPKPNWDDAPGELVQLSQGVTHYRWIGPVRGPVVVCVHGLTTPSDAWLSLAEGLGAAGYRVLVYDLYGRGYSSAPSGRQDRAFFLRQLSDLLEDQGLTEDLTILGYSMGGAIATAFAAENPHRMKRLVLVASAGVEVLRDQLTQFAIKTPVIGDWLHHGIGMARFRRQLAVTRDARTEVPGIADIQIAQLDRRGFRPAVLSSLRGMVAERQETDHRTLGREGVPVVAIWGKDDDVIPIRALGTLAQWNRATRQEVIEGAGHGLPYTHGAEVATLLRGILRETD